jgi:hypothetical protein
LLNRIGDVALAKLPPVGGIDQYVDSTDVLVRQELTRKIMTAVARLVPNHGHVSS